MGSRQDECDVRAGNLNRTRSQTATATVLHVKLVQGDEDVDTMQVHLGRAWQKCKVKLQIAGKINTIISITEKVGKGLEKNTYSFHRTSKCCRKPENERLHKHVAPV